MRSDKWVRREIETRIWSAPYPASRRSNGKETFHRPPAGTVPRPKTACGFTKSAGPASVPAACARQKTFKRTGKFAGSRDSAVCHRMGCRKSQRRCQERLQGTAVDLPCGQVRPHPGRRGAQCRQRWLRSAADRIGHGSMTHRRVADARRRFCPDSGYSGIPGRSDRRFSV